MFSTEQPRLRPHRYLAAAFAACLLGLALAACTGPGTPGTVAAPVPPTATQFTFPPTYTPLPPAPPTGTPTARPTRTPVPTQTLAATLQPSATPFVSLRPAAPEDRPVVAVSLLYVSEGAPMLWNGLTGQVEAVAPDLFSGRFDHIAFSPGGTYLAAARSEEGAAEILVYNRTSGAPTVQLSLPGVRIESLSISPGGAWLAYIALRFEPSPPQPPPATPESDQPTATPTTPPTPQPAGAALFLVPLGEPGNPVQAAACAGTCTPPVWSPFGDFLVWGDTAGLWEVELSAAAGPDPQQLLPPFLAGLSGASQTTDSYSPLSISPSSRFVLVRQGLTQGSVLAVTDRVTGAVEDLPGSGVTTGVGTGLTWLAGDLLFIGRPGRAALAMLPGAEVWAVQPDAGESMFLLAGDFPLPGADGVVPAAPAQLPDGRVGFTLINLQDGQDEQVNGLYLLDIAGGFLERVNFLPLMQATRSLWLPDGSGALVESQSRLLFVPSGFGQIYIMSSLLGPDACCGLWVP